MVSTPLHESTRGRRPPLVRPSRLASPFHASHVADKDGPALSHVRKITVPNHPAPRCHQRAYPLFGTDSSHQFPTIGICTTRNREQRKRGSLAKPDEVCLLLATVWAPNSALPALQGRGAPEPRAGINFTIRLAFNMVEWSGGHGKLIDAAPARGEMSVVFLSQLQNCLRVLSPSAG